MAKRPPLKGLMAAHVSPKGGGDASPAKTGSKAAASDDKKTRYLQTRVNDDGWHALKMLSVEERRPLQALFIEALNDLLRKYRKAPVVEGPAED